MKRFLCYNDPILFSLFGGAIIGAALSSIIGLAANTSLNNRWQYYVAGLTVLTFSGWIFTTLSVRLAEIKLLVESAPASVIATIGKSKLIDNNYEKNRKKLLFRFYFAFAFLILGLVLILFGPLFSQAAIVSKSCVNSN